VCPVVLYHRPPYAAAIEKGKGVTELGAKAAKAGDEIRELWSFLDKRSKGLGAGTAPTKGKRVSSHSREGAKS